MILAPSAPYRHGRWRWGGYDGGGPAQHLFNRAERKHLHIYLQNDIKNRGLFMFRLWMARRGGGGRGASHKISWRLQHLFSRAERKHACLHIYLQYEIKTYRPYSRYRVTRLCSDSLCIFPCNETHLLLKEKYCKMLKGKIRKPSKYRIILFEDLRNLLIMLNLKISIPVTNNATKFLKI